MQFAIMCVITYICLQGIEFNSVILRNCLPILHMVLKFMTVDNYIEANDQLFNI